MQKPPRSFLRKAKEILRDPEQLGKLIENAKEKLKDAASLESIKTEIKSLFRLLRAWKDGSYRNIRLAPLLKIAAAVLYFVWLVDLVPDFILGVGLMDDLGVFLWALSGVKNELQEFRNWENQQRPEVKA